MDEDELDALVRRVLSKPRKWNADTLGQRLGLLDEVRTRLGITTIPPIDVTPEQLERRRRERWNAKRRKQTRDQYLAASLTKAEPWKAEGISRPTWYRRRAKAEPAPRETGPRQQYLSVPTHTCLNPPPSLDAPTRPCDGGFGLHRSTSDRLPHRWLGAAP